MKTILFIYGTRPEAIKMIPLIKEFQKHSQQFRVLVCVTGQHRQMLDQINSFFQVTPDFDLDIMSPNQTLFDVTSRALLGLDDVLTKSRPDLVFVQGDTTTVLAGAIASFYKRVPFAHLEAGLRTGDLLSPFPEEANRKLTAQIASFHFCPTPGAAENLRKEGITNNVYVVGNTVIDALHLGLELIKSPNSPDYGSYFSFCDFRKRIVLVTGHRRESFGTGFEEICKAIAKVADSRGDVQFVYPVHLNPNVQEPVKRILGQCQNVKLIPPLEYPYLVWLLEQCHFVLTDSGGIQEEAPALGKPVLVMRDVTERQEGVDSGTARLVGTNADTIVEWTERLLDDPIIYSQMANSINPYGDGTTSRSIKNIISREVL